MHLILDNSLVEKRRKKRQSSRKAAGFSFDSKDESEEEYLTERGRKFQITGLIYGKDISPRVLLPILGTRKIRVSEAERREREEEQR